MASWLSHSCCCLGLFSFFKLSIVNILISCLQRSLRKSVGEHLAMKSVKGEPRCQPLALIMC